MSDPSDYPWNTHVGLADVSFYGPGMDTREEAESVKNIVETRTGLDVEVVEQ